MPVRIRLRRAGSNKKPFFRIVAADIRSPNTGRFLENIGWYDPKRKGTNYELDMARFDYWTQHGAQATDTVKQFAQKIRRAAKA
jgi:small subunit ribosomal protein S16